MPFNKLFNKLLIKTFIGKTTKLLKNSSESEAKCRDKKTLSFNLTADSDIFFYPFMFSLHRFTLVKSQFVSIMFWNLNIIFMVNLLVSEGLQMISPPDRT